MMMIAFGLGEALGETTHVSATRIVASVLFVAVLALWFVGADSMITALGSAHATGTSIRSMATSR